MARDWDKFNNDEIMGIWGSYMRTEFPEYNNPLASGHEYAREVRLTALEVIKLVEELMDRLEIKERMNEEPLETKKCCF
jgi:hypothetical protein